MRPDGPRPLVAGPASGPEAPFPIKLSGPVIKGFGRGSKELGIPTANIPPSGLSAYPSLESGVYYGWVGLLVNPEEQPAVHPAVLSIGYNPFYANKTRSIEIHLLSSFPTDFYDASLNLLILGYIRPEYDYVSKESLIEDIKFDCEVARRSLGREAYETFRAEQWLREFKWREHVDVREVEREVLGGDKAAEGEGKL